MHKQPRWFWLVLWLWPFAAHAQDVFTLTAASLQNGQAVELDKLGWKYSPDDDPRFADPQFDDRAWETLQDTAIKRGSIPISGWRGIGWFRLRLRVEPALKGVPLNLELFHLGASEIHLDGKLIGRFGVVGKTQAEESTYNPNASPLGIVFGEAVEHVLALRYSNQQSGEQNSFWHRWQLGIGDGIGLKGRIRYFGEATNQGKWAARFTLSYDVFQGAVSLTLGILHLLLFVLFPRQRANLYYSLYLLGIALNNYFLFRMKSLHSGLTIYYLEQVANMIVGVPNNVFLLAFIYMAFSQRIPRRIWLFATVSLLVPVLQAVYPGTLKETIEGFFILVVGFETLRVTYPAVLQHQPGAWMVGLGLSFNLVYAIRSLFSAAVSIPQTLYVAMDLVGTYGLMLAISLYLAREFARVNQGLEEQLIQVKQLSTAALEHEKVKAEHDRKTKELEEARQLQLSMLPKKLPNLPHLDIAAYMKTATEVGGDYYDFHTTEDGTLTIAVGDATGHGLKAGTMVASVKSLFMTLAYHPDIPHIFTRLSQTLKQMNLRGLFMALTIAKVKENCLTISLAGMPPVWLYRAATQQIEDIALQQLPLGGVTKYVYQQREYELASGDVVVLLSDGLPERFNEAGAMLEDEAAKQWLTTNAQLSAQALIAGLAQLGDEWGGARSQDDDVTLVVLKVK